MKKEVKIFALGGLGEVGKNMYCVEYQDELMIMDVGILFPDDNLLGIDYVIQDYSYIRENKHKVVGIFITHGHEDHIGAIPFFLREFNFPIHANGLAVGLIKAKVREHKGIKANIIEFQPDDVIKFKNLEIEFFRTNHSIPDSFGVAIRTPLGLVVNTGDFKFDLTPMGPPADIQKMALLSKEGILCLMSDSTNSELDAFTTSESLVGNSIKEIFRNIEGRIVIATFASNVHRVQQIVEASIVNNRKIAVYGRSMEKVVDIGTKMGYIKAPKGTFIDGRHIKSHELNEITIICTGSQGEQMAALSRIANNTHKQIALIPGDTIIFSSSPIPGNGESVGRTINSLFKNGANVIVHSPLNDTHTSGHGGAEELKLMLNIMKPKFFMPVHGEYRMLKRHTKLAQETGIDLKDTFILDNGDVLKIDEDGARIDGKVKSGDVYIDGKGIGDIISPVIKDRKKLSSDGLLSVILTIDTKTFDLVSRPTIISRGFIYMKDNTKITHSIQKLSIALTKKELSKKEKFDLNHLKVILNTELSNHIFRLTDRTPIMMPVIMTINK